MKDACPVRPVMASDSAAWRAWAWREVSGGAILPDITNRLRVERRLLAAHLGSA